MTSSMTEAWKYNIRRTDTTSAGHMHQHYRWCINVLQPGLLPGDDTATHQNTTTNDSHAREREKEKKAENEDQENKLSPTQPKQYRWP